MRGTKLYGMIHLFILNTRPYINEDNHTFAASVCLETVLSALYGVIGSRKKRELILIKQKLVRCFSKE